MPLLREFLDDSVNIKMHKCNEKRVKKQRSMSSITCLMTLIRCRFDNRTFNRLFAVNTCLVNLFCLWVRNKRIKRISAHALILSFFCYE